MKRKVMAKGLGIAFASLVGLGLTGQASADVYGVSQLNIDNLTIGFSEFEEGSTPTTYLFTSSSTATLDGVGSPGDLAVDCGGTFAPGANTGDCGNAPEVLSGVVSNAIGSEVTRNESDTTTIFGNGANYSNAESIIRESTISSGGLEDYGLRVLFSEVNLTTGTSGNANTTTSSQTSIEVEFTIAEGVTDGTITINFDADWLVEAIITAPDEGQSIVSVGFRADVIGTEGDAPWLTSLNGNRENSYFLQQH